MYAEVFLGMHRHRRSFTETYMCTFANACIKFQR